MEQLHTFNAELENKLANAALALGDLTSFCTEELSAYKDKLQKWGSADITHKQALAKLHERVLESDKEAAEALSGLAVLKANYQTVLSEAVMLKSRCQSQEQQISRLNQQAEEALTAHKEQVKHLQEQLEAALAYRRKCQSLHKELEEVKALLASQQADASLVGGTVQEREVIAKLQAAQEEATSQLSASSMQPLQLRLREAEQALKREQEARQQEMAAAANDKRDWVKQKEVLKAAYREQNRLRKDLERKVVEIEQYATNALQGWTPHSGGNVLRSPSRATLTATPSAHALAANQGPGEQLQDPPLLEPRVLQPLNLPAQPSASLAVSQKSTEAICRAAAADADTACCPQTISSRCKQRAAVPSADGPAFDRVYDNPCAEEPAPDPGWLSGEGNAENWQPDIGPANPAFAAEPELQTTALPECCMPPRAQDDAMDVDERMEKGQSSAQADVKQQGGSTNRAEDVIDLASSPDDKSHPDQRAPLANAVPEIDRPLSSIARKAGPKEDSGEQQSGRRARRRATTPQRHAPLESPEPPGPVGAEADEHLVRHTAPPSRPWRLWRETGGQGRSHVPSGTKVSPFRRKRKSPDLEPGSGPDQGGFAGVGLTRPHAKPAGRDCGTWQFRNVVSKPTAASDSSVPRARKASQNQYQAFDAACGAEPQLSPDATQCNSPAPEPPMPEEPLRAEALPREKSHCAHSGIQRASAGQQDGPAWKSRGGREATENGVAHTLHLLDMQQGLLRVTNTGGSGGGGKGTPRLPTIVERAEAARMGACPAGPRPVSSNEPGYKYQDVVRKKAERELLQGFDCQDCKGFYQAVASWGVVGDLPVCGHVNAAASSGGKGQRPPIAQMQQDGSRHRYRYEPPATPDGFWDMGFLDSQDSRMQ